jgi:hypothetical protein
MAERPLLRVEDLRLHYRTGRGIVHAVDGVSFELRRNEALTVNRSGLRPLTTSSTWNVQLLGTSMAWSGPVSTIRATTIASAVRTISSRGIGSEEHPLAVAGLTRSTAARTRTVAQRITAGSYG